MRFVTLMVALFAATYSASADPQVTGENTLVNIVFYVKDGNASPYQGLLQLTPAEYAALTPVQIQERQLAQYNTWKANYDALRAAQATQDQPQ